MPTFNGTLYTNEAIGALYNMIISERTFASPIAKVKTLASRSKVDGGLYGDTKLYVSTDALKSREWMGDAEAANLLTLHRPPAPKTQSIRISRFRIVPVTIDNYLSKRAFMNPGDFIAFNSVVVSWVSITKDLYEETMVNAFYGTNKGTTAEQSITISLPTQVKHYLDDNDALQEDVDQEATNRLQAQTLAEAWANLKTKLTKIASRKYNDNQFLRRYAPGELLTVWNEKFVNKILKLDLPGLYHKDIFDDMSEVLPGEFFGETITADNVSDYSASTPTTGKPINSTTHAYTPGTNNANGTIRAREEMEITVSNVVYHCFAGEELPAGAVIYTSSTENLYGKIYIEDPDIAFKLTVDGATPLMSGFVTETNFFNPLSLTESKFLIWSHNNMEHLKEYPFITAKVTRS